MSSVSTKKAPAAIGPYSQGISANGFVFVSGQLPINPSTGTIAEGSIKDRTIQSMMNIGEILKEAGSGLDKVVKTTIFVTNLELFGEVNEAYGTFLAGMRLRVRASRLRRFLKGQILKLRPLQPYSRGEINVYRKISLFKMWACI